MDLIINNQPIEYYFNSNIFTFIIGQILKYIILFVLYICTYYIIFGVIFTFIFAPFVFIYSSYYLVRFILSLYG